MADGNRQQDNAIRTVVPAQLEPYVDWLLQRQLTSAKRAPYYARWVQRYLRYRGTRPRESWQDSLRGFLEMLAADPWTQDWYLRQAGEAVSLYCGQFRVEEETAASPGRHAVVAGHAEAVAEMERLLELRHYSPRTQRSYTGWARRFLSYVDPRARRVPAVDDVSAFLSHLATVQKVASSTQNQAFHALLFLCRHVLDVDMGEMPATMRARRGPRLPVVLSQEETRAVLEQLGGMSKLMLELVYGAGLRLGEVVALRVKDADLDAGLITVRAAKGDKDRTTMLPQRLVEPLHQQLERVRELHGRDLAGGAGEAPLPDALARKYPQAGRDWCWQYVFPARTLDVHPDGVIRRWHVSPAALQKAMKQAVRRSGIAKPASVHTLRHAYATHLLLQGVDIRRVQELMGHRSVETTMIYTHVMRSMAPAVRSPLDEL